MSKRRAPHQLLSSDLVHGLAQVLFELRLSVPSWIRASGVPSRELERGRGKLRVDVAARLFRAISEPEDSHSPRLGGLQFGALVSMRSLGILGELMTHARTLRDALGLVSLCELHGLPRVPSTLIERNEVATWRLRAPVSDDETLWATFRREAQLAVFVRIARLIDPGWGADYVSLTSSSTASSSEDAQLFGCSMRYDAPNTEITFARAALDRENPSWDESLWLSLKTLAEQRASEDVRASTPVHRRVLALLHAEPRLHALGTHEVAERLGISHRVLRRRLFDEGSSFEALANQARLEWAIRALQDSDQSLEAISGMMGYAAMSGFNRAFKRQSGMSPARFRRLAIVDPVGAATHLQSLGRLT